MFMSKISYKAMISNTVLKCPKCDLFIKATSNTCKCGYNPSTSYGMVKEEGKEYDSKGFCVSKEITDNNKGERR